MSFSLARKQFTLPQSTNKATHKDDRLMPEELLIDIFNDSIKKCFPELDNVFLLHSRLEGDAHEKYGDYVCMSILTICERKRRLDPDLFDKNRTQDIAELLLQGVKKHPQSRMITQLRLHDVGFLTYKLSSKWMTERINKMINEGMDTWAPVICAESIVIDGPTPDISAHQHAEEIRFRYIKEMLISMLDYSGVDVGSSLTNNQSTDAVREHFAENLGVITSKRHQTSLFVVKGGSKANNFCEDLQTLWSGIYTLRGRLVVYLTPVRRREYVNKCFAAAIDEEWLSVQSSLRCCGYRTTSNEREKLDYLWKIYEQHPNVASLVELGYAAGYTREASMECAIKYTYLKTHRLAECSLNIDEILNEKGNTFVCLLKTLVFCSSLPENLGGGVVVKYTEEFFNKERELALHLVQFTEVIERACVKFLLHPVCEYIWVLCKKFTSYYNEVMKFLDLGTYKLKFFLCDATKLVIKKCIHLLGITPDSSIESSNLPKVKTGFEFEINPYFPSDSRPNNMNPRFEMFCMNIAVADSSFEKGNLHGIVSLVDADGLLSDGRLPLNMKDHDHVAYFYREWYDTIGICNNAYVYFGNPSPCHLVPFSSSLELYVRLFVTTADKCFQMCNSLETIKLSEFWGEEIDHKRGTLTYKGNDGCIFIDYIALKDAVDVNMKLSFESPNDPRLKACVSGCILAYYGDLLDGLDSLRRGCYKAIIFKAAEVSKDAKDDSMLGVGSIPLRKSVMAVPVNGSLVFEARFYDEFGKVLFRRRRKFNAQTQHSDEWSMPLNNDCFLKLTLEWSQGQVATPFDY